MSENRSSTDQRRFESLDAALREMRIPLENHVVIREFTNLVGVESYYATMSYIRAVRANPGPDLRIAYGWSNGFTEPEVQAIMGTQDRWESDDRRGLWGIGHPVARPGSGGAASTTSPSYGTCPRCFTEFSANGTCACD